MELLRFIDLAIGIAKAEGKLPAAKAYAKTMKPLRMYVQAQSDTDIDILSLCRPDFIGGFEQYLTTEYAKTLDSQTISESTVEKHVKNLRLLARIAINQGFIPNIKIDGEDKLEIKTFSADASTDFANIVTRFAIVGEQLSNHLFTTESDEKIARIEHRSLGLVILAILCGGLSLDQLSQLSRADLEADTLRLPHLGIEIQLPRVIKDGDLLSHLPDTPTESTLLAANAQTILEKNGIKSPRILDSAFAYWLSLCLEHGIPVRAVREMAQGSGEGLQETVQKAVNQIAYKYGGIFRHWYAVKCIKLSGSELADEIVKLHGYTQSRLYAPQNIIVKEVNGRRIKINNPIIDKILFIRATGRQIDSLQRNIRTQGIVYSTSDDEGYRSYDIIPDRELDNFRRFLGTPGVEPIPLDPTMHYSGAKVSITGGPFIGCEGIIDDIKIERDGASEYVKCFIVRIEGISVLGILDIDPALCAVRSEE